VQTVSNVVFSLIFLMEMVLKIGGMGVYGYCFEWFNVFDGLIVVTSILEFAI